MKINIRGEKIKITSAMKDYAKAKLEKLSKYFKQQEEITAYLLFKINGPRQKLEMTIPLKNCTLRVEEIGEDFYATIDTAIDKLERQIIKNKTRIESKKMKEKFGFSIEQLEMIDDLKNNNKNKIVKRKKIELKPMDEEEAILQMELLGHDFYIFKNIDTNKMSILYRRKLNGYGLIEEE